MTNALRSAILVTEERPAFIRADFSKSMIYFLESISYFSRPRKRVKTHPASHTPRRVRFFACRNGRQNFMAAQRGSSAALAGSFAPILPFEKLEILRSRWRRRSLTDAAMPLAGTHSIPAFSKPCLDEKSLAVHNR